MKLPGIGKRKERSVEEERLHAGPVVIQDEHVSAEYCENELHGVWDERKQQCIVEERELPDGSKVIGSPNVKIIRDKKTSSAPGNPNEDLI